MAGTGSYYTYTTNSVLYTLHYNVTSLVLTGVSGTAACHPLLSGYLLIALFHPHTFLSGQVFSVMYQHVV
jgi:hypothetical protein